MKKKLKHLISISFACILGACVDANNISVTELSKINDKHNDKIAIIDVRSADEYNTSHAKGAINIPAFEYIDNSWVEVKDFAESVNTLYLNSGKKLYIMCKSGGRSLKATSTLHKNGWSKDEAINVTGGFTDWSNNNLPTE